VWVGDSKQMKIKFKKPLLSNNHQNSGKNKRFRASWQTLKPLKNAEEKIMAWYMTP